MGARVVASWPGRWVLARPCNFTRLGSRPIVPRVASTKDRGGGGSYPYEDSYCIWPVALDWSCPCQARST